jgi:hypothetical protein
MQCLDFAALVVLSICRHFSIFVSINGRAKLPTVKFQQTLWFPGYASVFEISWFITNSSPLSIYVSSYAKESIVEGFAWTEKSCYDKGFVVTLLCPLVFCV